MGTTNYFRILQGTFWASPKGTTKCNSPNNDFLIFSCRPESVSLGRWVISCYSLSRFCACSPAETSGPFFPCHHYAFMMTEIIPQPPLAPLASVCANMSNRINSLVSELVTLQDFTVWILKLVSQWLAWALHSRKVLGSICWDRHVATWPWWIKWYRK